MDIDLKKKIYAKMRKLLNPEINPSEKEKKKMEIVKWGPKGQL